MDVLALLDELDELVENAKPLPLSEQVRLDREEIYNLLDEIRAALPAEVKQARSVVRERQELFAGGRRECEQMLGKARAEAARERSPAEIARIGERQAEQLLAEARLEARALRQEADDWADRILAVLELDLGKFLQAVRSGRERLHERSSQESVFPAANGTAESERAVASAQPPAGAPSVS